MLYKLLFILIVLSSCASVKECSIAVGNRNIIERVRLFEIENEFKVTEIDSSIVNRSGLIFVKYKNQGD